MIEVRLIAAAQVALQTGFGVFLGIPLERKDELCGGGGLRIVSLRGFFGIRVCFPRAMAHFATRYGVRLRGFEHGVPRLPIFQEFGAMAGTAAIRPGVFTRGSLLDISYRN
jgi:hypothetical protein